MEKRVFARRMEREFHLSEQGVWQTIVELYRVGWIKSVKVEKMYIEKVQKMPLREKNGPKSWERIALVRIPEARREIGAVVLLIQLVRFESEREFWGAYTVQVWSEHAPSCGMMRPAWCLYNCGRDPLLWVPDRDPSKAIPLPWQTINLLGEKKKREFVSRFLDYLTSWHSTAEEKERKVRHVKSADDTLRRLLE